MSEPPTPSSRSSYDAVVVGSGPNGLAAAITLAEAGRSVVVIEGRETVGGGARTADLTLPGFRHDVCSSVHPFGAFSPVFKAMPLERYGLEWIEPPVELAHPFDDGSAAILHRSVDVTAASLGVDADAWRKLIQPLLNDVEALFESLLGPLQPPRHPIAMARFGLAGLRSITGLSKTSFTGKHAPGLLGGIAAHSMVPLEQPPTAAFALMLGLAGHFVGWPYARGGSQAISDALAAHLRAVGGEIVTGWTVSNLRELPRTRAVLFDTSARRMVDIAGDALPDGYRRQISRFRRGPGVFKIDYALSAPVPWTNEECHKAGTLHLGGTLEEMTSAERAVANDEHPQRPIIISAQNSRFDPTRAPDGQHTFWVYTHVPNGSTVDMTEPIETQIERFAPGFRDTILARHTMNSPEFEAYNPNYIGGDINGGLQDLRQLFTRPAPRLNPYSTPNPRLYICSSSTPPGGGVHGIAGWFAAQSALRRALK
ncbi:MAG TPA: NAD(P)/FAD-dependent oxidoreductase [Thermomicrobiales bacterium]|nr:NAD(P)/FAD-dependent oxidoreductase [Thermomicrobiales bacterium]